MHDFTVVEFPKLGWSFNVPSILADFTIPGINLHLTIHWYGVIIAFGFLLAVLLGGRMAYKWKMSLDKMVDVLIFGTFGGIIGARLFYVIFEWEQYKDHLLDIFKIWEGGMAIYGGIIGGLLAAWAVCHFNKLNFRNLLDIGAISLLLAQGIGRWGNFMNREAFGAETPLPWRMQLTTVTGQLVEVHPTFLYESLWNLAGLLLIIFVVSKARRFDGENTWFYFLWYGIGRFWIEGLRTDSLYLFNWTIGGQPIRVSQALSLVMVFVSLFMLYYNIKLHPHKPEELYVNIVAARNAAAAEAAVAPAAESPAQATPTEDAPAVSSEPEAPSQKDTSGETPTEDPS